MTIAELLERAETGTPSTPMPTTYDFYIDSAASGGGDGLTPETAYNTPAAVTFTTGKKYGFKRGSFFRYGINIQTIPNVIFGVYGSGALPVFDCSALADNDDFVGTSGQPNVYEIEWANEFTPGYPSQHSVWEDDVRLWRATSLANCQASPGSFYPEEIVLGGTSVVYVHPSDSSDLTTNGKVYEITKLDIGVWLGDNSKAYFLHTRRNGTNNGSFQIGINAYAYGILAEDGVKHNLFFEDGLAERCTVWKCDTPVVYGGATAYISYTNRSTPATLSVTLKDCNLMASYNDNKSANYGLIGWYAHVGGATYYNNVTVDGGWWGDCGDIFGGEIGYPYTIKNFRAENYSRLFNGSTVTGPVLIEYADIHTYTDYSIFVNSPLTMRQNKIHSGTENSKFIRQGYTPHPVTLERNTFVGSVNNVYLLDILGGTLPTIINNENIFLSANGSVVVLASALADGGVSIANVSGDGNFYKTPAIYAVAPGSVPVSTRETDVFSGMSLSSFLGSFTDGSFYLPDSHPAFGKAGSDSTFIVPQPVDNIIGPGPNVLVADGNKDFVEAGINADNTTIIYEVGQTMRSYKPGRTINGTTAFESGKGYYIVAKLSLYIAELIPPII